MDRSPTSIPVKHLLSRDRGWLFAGLIVLGGLGAGALVLRPAASSSAAAVQSSEARAALTVELALPQVVDWPELIHVAGDIAAWQEAVIGAELGGLHLVEVVVNVGDTVHRGDLLARFDDDMIMADLNQQKAAVAEAQAALTEAEANAGRAQTLRRTGSLSEQNITQYATQAQTATARLDSARARLRIQELKLKYTRVLAPNDGIISSRSATLGSVAPTGAELFRLIRQNRLEWRAELTAAQLIRAHPGQTATLQLPDGATATGTVRQLAPLLDARSRTGIAYIDLDPRSVGSARAGMYATGAIALGKHPGLAAPAAGVVVRDGREYVFAVDADRRVVQTEVVTGRRQGVLVEINSGLTENQPVVAAGAAFLNDGDRVRVVEIAGHSAKPTP